jgi:vancomycin resistance protein YoaR
LERARKAEAEAATLKAQLKSDTQSNKKTIREMEAQVAQSTAVSQKSEREYITLRDSLKQLSEGWKTDMEKLRIEMRRREEKWRGEAVEAGVKYKKLLEEVEKERAEKESLAEIRKEMEHVQKKWETGFLARLEELEGGIGRSERETEAAGKIARYVSNPHFHVNSC